MSTDMFATICATVMETGSVQSACKQHGITPARVWEHAFKHQDAKQRLWEARKVGAEMRWDECIAIADAMTGESWQRDRVRIDTRMRVAGKLDPERYGDQ